jgi:hypothetical protein
MVRLRLELNFNVFRIGCCCLILALTAVAQQADSDQRRIPAPPVKGRVFRRLPEPRAGILNGRFIAQAAGPRISGFSPNLETYIFEADLRGYTQLVKVNHEFLHQEPRLPGALLDYNQVRSFAAVRDSSCDEKWQSLSTRLVFDQSGEVVARRTALTYADAAPSPSTTDDEVLPCYVVGRLTPNMVSKFVRQR